MSTITFMAKSYEGEKLINEINDSIYGDNICERKINRNDNTLKKAILLTLSPDQKFSNHIKLIYGRIMRKFLT